MKKTILETCRAVVTTVILAALGFGLSFCWDTYARRTITAPFSAEDFREVCAESFHQECEALRQFDPQMRGIFTTSRKLRKINEQIYVAGDFQAAIKDDPQSPGGKLLGDFAFRDPGNDAHPADLFARLPDDFFAQALEPRFGVNQKTWRERMLGRAKFYRGRSPWSQRNVYLCVTPDGGMAIVIISCF